MTYKGHIVAGVTLGSAVGLLFDIDVSSVGYLAFVVVGSLLPDIDIKNSKINQYNIFSFMTSKLKHRGVTHTLLGCGVIGVPVFLLGYRSEGVFIGYLVGYLSHLIADSFNPKGIMWRYPFSKKYYNTGLTFKTGGTGESIVTGILIVIGISLLTLLV